MIIPQPSYDAHTAIAGCRVSWFDIEAQSLVTDNSICLDEHYSLSYNFSPGTEFLYPHGNMGKKIIVPWYKPQNGWFQTSLAFQENDHATAASQRLGSQLSLAIHIPCRIITLEHEKIPKAHEKTQGTYWRNLVIRRQNLKKSDEDSSFLSHWK